MAHRHAYGTSTTLVCFSLSRSYTKENFFKEYSLRTSTSLIQFGPKRDFYCTVFTKLKYLVNKKPFLFKAYYVHIHYLGMPPSLRDFGYKRHPIFTGNAASHVSPLLRSLIETWFIARQTNILPTSRRGNKIYIKR